jgi:hypothetical protein
MSLGGMNSGNVGVVYFGHIGIALPTKHNNRRKEPMAGSTAVRHEESSQDGEVEFSWGSVSVAWSCACDVT